MIPNFYLWLLLGTCGLAIASANVGFDFTEAKLDSMFEKLDRLSEIMKTNTEAMRTFQQNTQPQMETRIQQLTDVVKNNTEKANLNEQATKSAYETRLAQLTQAITGNDVSIKDVLKTTTKILSHVTCKVQNADLICRTNSSGDGWMVIQQRFDGSTEFNRTWEEYVKGFGSVGPTSEFWVGLNRLRQLTEKGNYELLIELRDEAGEYRFARYSQFVIEDESQKYMLAKLENYSGTAGDLCYHTDWRPKGQMFSTFDSDNDQCKCSCAVNQGGGWWFNVCGTSLNAQWGKVKWYAWKNHDLRFVRMLIRNKS